MRQTAKLTASDGQANDQFGSSVSIAGNTAVVGAQNATIGSNASQGAGYIYMKPAAGWKNTSRFNAKLIAADGATPDELGWSASISGSTIVLGAPFATVNGNAIEGAVYVFGP